MGSEKKKLSRLLAAWLILLVLSVWAVPAQARDRDGRCAQRIHKAEAKLQQAISRHGEHSRQAQKRRRELEQTRASCRGDGDRDRDRDRDRR